MFLRASLLCLVLATLPTALANPAPAAGVQWHSWNESSLAEARRTGRCVYVFISQPLSELSRDTFSQTFSNPKTAAWLNDNFYCILVDADSQPDLAAFGQHFIGSVKQLHGWPVHLWFTPDLQPYDGANYLPPSEEWGKPGFLKSARAALDAWTLDPARARALAAEARAILRPLPLSLDGQPDYAKKLETAAAAWIADADRQNGGFGEAPKSAEPELIRFLIARGGASRDVAIDAARAAAGGALRDSNDGGFFRRCIDGDWKEPYLQKLLVDQARMAVMLLDAADAASDERLRVAALGALDFTLASLRNPDGSFSAALDGTLAETPAPGQRPQFIRTGSASTGAIGLLVVAMQRSGEKRFGPVVAELAARLRGEPLFHDQRRKAEATAFDYLAAALALRSLQDDAAADRLIARVNALYFDSATGTYQATPAELPLGITARPPALGDAPAAELLALLAGVDPKTAALLRRAIYSQIEFDERPAGDLLLALASH